MTAKPPTSAMAERAKDGLKPVTAWAGYRSGVLLWFCTDPTYAQQRAKLFGHQLKKVRVTPV